MERRNFIRKAAYGTAGLSALSWIPVVSGKGDLMMPADPGRMGIPGSVLSAGFGTSLEWVRDALVVAMPAASVGGAQAGIYTAAENGIRPWRQAIIRWLTSRDVQGNAAALVRQEGPEGGAGLTAIIDPNADYLFEVLVHVPGGVFFGDAQDKNLPVWIAVMDMNDNIIAEEQVKINWGDWATARVSFSSGNLREVRCIVQARSPKFLPCLYFTEGYNLIRKDHAWWNPQNLFCSSRTVARLKDERQTLVQTLDPDLVGGHNGVYLNWDGFFTKQGIAVGGGHWEQEYNHLSVDDPMYGQFLEDGLARNLDGTTISTSKLWPGYHMCHNAPGWHSYYKKRLTRVAPEVHMISQDNICSSSFMSWGKNGCFCRWCRQDFRDWLRNNLTKTQMEESGIGNPDSFDIVDYIGKVKGDTIDKGLDAVLRNAVLREYVRFSYVSQAGRWRDSVEAVKKAAGHPVAVCGNQWGSNGLRPYSTLLSQICDVTCTETSIGSGSMTVVTRTWNALATKASFAAGEYRRPVWLYLSSLFHTAQAAGSSLRMANNQAWSDGGAPMPWATAPGSSGWLYDIEAGLCRFIQRHRALFTRRESCTNVGLVYSIPAFAWRFFPAFHLSPEKYQNLYVALAQILEEMHIPYEVNCWWHPLLGDEKISLERLSKYKVLVIPGVDCFSDAQHDAVRAFQKRGGKVITVPFPVLYDADMKPRPAGQTLAAPGKTLYEIRSEQLEQYLKLSQNPSPETAKEAGTVSRKIYSLLRKAMKDAEILETNAPADVWSNLWLDESKKVLALHLVNGNIDLKEDKFLPVDGSRWKIKLPAGMDISRAVAITPDKTEESSSVPVEVSGGWATLVVPQIESYTIVALFQGNALEEEEQKARSRRESWRKEIANGALSSK